MDIQAIHSEDDYKAQLALVSRLVDLDPDVGTLDGDELNIRSILIEDYERQRFPIEAPDPVEAIKFRMEQLALAPKDLTPIIGARNRVHEILTRRRSLTLGMIRRLNKELKIPAAALIGEPLKTPKVKKGKRRSQEAVAL